MFAGSGGSFGDGSGHAGRPALGNHDTVGSCSIRGAQYRAQVMWILYAVEYDYQRILPSLACEHIIEIAVLFGGRDCDDSLVRRVAGHAIEFGALQEAHGYAQAAAVFDQALQADVVAFFRHADPLEVPSASLQGFGDGVDAVDVVHEVSVYRGSF